MTRSRSYPMAHRVVRLDKSVSAASPAAPLRPPHGVPLVRPPVRKPVVEAQRRDPDTLAAAARYAHLQQGGDGVTMEIGIDADLFEGLACQVRVEDGRVLATFKTGGDPNLRRLLDAERGRLRAALEGRGMRKVDIVIEG